MLLYISIVFYGLLCEDILNCLRLLYIFSFHHTTKNDYLHYFVFSVAKARLPNTFFGFLFWICPKLRKDKSNHYVGMKRRHLAGQNLAGVNNRLMYILYFVIARGFCRISLFWGKRKSERRR